MSRRGLCCGVTVTGQWRGRNKAQGSLSMCLCDHSGGRRDVMGQGCGNQAQHRLQGAQGRMCSAETPPDPREHGTAGSLGGNGAGCDKGRNSPATNISSSSSRNGCNVQRPQRSAAASPIRTHAEAS